MTTLIDRPKAPGVSEESRYWQAVLTRDRSFDGFFVYGVSSTMIYCRPICPSRRPQRAKAAFFSGPEAAEQEGFRPCLRCRPDQGSPDQSQIEMVLKACRYINRFQEEPPRLAQLAVQLDVSPGHLQRVFKRLIGVTPRQYADACRRDRFRLRLKEGGNVTAALYEAGYGSSSRLYEHSSAHLGMTPASYGRGGRGARIAYTLVDSPMGRLLVAATNRGVCAVKLGDRDSELEADLRAEYPAAELYSDPANLKEWVETLLGYLRGELPDPGLPLDIRATAFQRLVWEHLRSIPYGQTSTYQEVAEALGRPKANRAVARACATNPVSLVVPCHRVVRKDGGLGGYRWGLNRKALLLAKEQALASKLDQSEQ